MARKLHPITTTHISLACGATDQTNVTNATCPHPNAQLLQAAVTQQVAGGTTGTFGIEIKSGSTSLIPATATSYIDADAVAGTIHGVLTATKGITLSEGALISVATVKNGTVSSNATLAICLTWRI